MPCFEATIDAGATVINIPDTLGYMQPAEFADLVRTVMGRVPTSGGPAVSVHCHNDLGMATALSLVAVKAGAEWVVHGQRVGERAGNASLEEIVMTLKTRADYFQAETGLRTEQIWRTRAWWPSTWASRCSRTRPWWGQRLLPRLRATPGRMLKERTTYEIMTPESIGRTDSRS